MKPSLLKQSLISFFFAFFLLTNLNANDLSVYEQLCNLNKYWQQHDEYKSLLCDKTQFDSDRALIQAHLSLVEQHLRNNYDSNLTEKQLSKRNAGLDILNTYWNNGVFPINTKHVYTVPYFIDDYNTACAVGHIMRESGATEIVNLVKERDNYAYIEDMKFPKLGEWAKEYGFSVEELKWIQPAYDPVIEISTNKTEANCGNVDGAVDVEILSGTFDVTNYEWRLGVNETNTVITTNQDLSNAASGFYSLKMFDPNIDPNDLWGRPVTKRISLDDVEGPEFSATMVNQTCYDGDLDGLISLELPGNASDYQIKWYDYEENLLATDVVELNELEGYPLYIINGNPPPYNYRVEVEDANGCKSYQEFFLTFDSEGPYLSSFQTEITAATCDAGGSIILGNVYSATAVEYYWNDGNTNADREDLVPGTYTLTIVDEFGCSIQETIEIENQCIVGSTCQDLAGIDFGDCDFVLGIALVDGECINLSGCDWTVNGVDYSDHFFTDMQVCIQSCETSTCEDLGGIDFGICALVLGIALVDGECVSLSGCDWTVNGVDYSDHFFTDMQVCVESCETSPCDFDGTIASLPWLETLANGTEHSIQHFIYNGADVFFHKYCPEPPIADAMSILYDCSGNPICYFEGFGGFTGENCPGFPYNAIFQSHLTDCELTSCASSSAADILQEQWVQDIIDEAENAVGGMDCACYESIDLVSYGDNGIGVWVNGSDDCNASDFPDVLFTCNGVMVCAIGEVHDYDFCYESVTVIENIWTCSPTTICTFDGTVESLPWLVDAIDQYSQYDDCGCIVSIDVVEYDGQTAIYFDSNCHHIDDSDLVYDCEGNLICTLYGLTSEYCTESVTYIETLWTCPCAYDGTVESLWWLNVNPIDPAIYFYEYEYNGEPVFLSGPCEVYPDALTTLLDCSGSQICYWGGIAGHNGEGCPDFVDNAAFVKSLVGCADSPCEVANPITDLPWLIDLVDEYSQFNGCACLTSIDIVDYDGQTAIYFDSDCHELDDSDLVYDCEGNLICTLFGDTQEYCTGTVTHLETIWTCPNFTVNASLDYKVFLEGPYMDDGTMSTELYDRGLLPLNQPFAGSPYNYSEPLTRTANIPGAVDWIMLELREDPSVSDGIQVPGILLSDGRIVDPVTLSYPIVELESLKEYFVLVRHRNHLDIYSTLRKLPSSHIPYDFRNSNQHTIDQVKQTADGRFAMYAGDHNSDGTISIGDFDYWKINPAMLNVYDNADYNLDGIVQTTDWDQWYINRSKIGLISD